MGLKKNKKTVTGSIKEQGRKNYIKRKRSHIPDGISEPRNSCTHAPSEHSLDKRKRRKQGGKIKTLFLGQDLKEPATQRKILKTRLNIKPEKREKSKLPEAGGKA